MRGVFVAGQNVSGLSPMFYTDLATRAKRAVLLASSASLALSAAAAAQEEDASKSTVEEIIVTANKRAASTVDVPIAISAYTGRFLRQTNLDDIKDLVKFTPGFAGDTKDSFIDFLNLRGISTNDFGVGGDPSIAIFKDNLYQGRNGVAVTSLFDVERAEVLRGPQGFLFGRNAIAGAISLHSVKPNFDGVNGYFDAGVGERSIVEGEGAINVAVSEQLAFRIATYYSHEDGYVDNLLTSEDDELIGHEKFATRASVRTKTDRIDLTLRFEYEDRDQEGSIYTSQHALGDFPDIEAAFGDYSTPRNIRQIEANADLGIFDRGEVYSIGMDLEVQLDGMIFQALGQYRDHDYSYAEDFDGTRLALNDYSQDQSGDYWEGEVRMLSDTDSPLQWYAGVSVYREEIDALFTNRQGEEELCNYYYYTSCTDYLGAPNFTVTPLGLQESNRARGQYWGLGAYLNLTYQIDPKWQVEAGLRYNYDEKDFAMNVLPVASDLGPFFTFGFTTDGFVQGQRDFDAFTPRFVVRYQPNDDWTIYASATRGYKAGGFASFGLELGPDGTDDDAVALPGATADSFEPETVWSFETGAKGVLFDGRLKLDLTGYYYTYNDLQLVIFESGGSQVFNIGEAEGYGLEFTADAIITDWLDVFIASSLQDSEVINADGFCEECVGNRLPYQPEFSVSGQVRAHVAAFTGELEAFVDWRAQTSTFGGLDNINALSAPGYDDWSARLGYRDESGWFVTAYVENLFNEDYFDVSNEGDGLVPPTLVGPSRPRTFGIRFGATFGE